MGALVVLLALSACTDDAGTPPDPTTPSSGSGEGERPEAGGGTDARTAVTARRMGRQIDALVTPRGSIWSSMRTVLVTLGDQVVVERHYDGPRSQDVSSLTATVVGTLAGIAVERGILRLSDRLDELLPAYRDQMSSVMGATTLEQLLTMQSGLEADLLRDTAPPFAVTHDWVGTILRGGLSGTPTEFAYSSAAPHLVAAALREATGEPLATFARRVLFRPLGRPGPLTWATSPTGEEIGFAGLRLDAEDLQALGQLYLDGGRADGRTVLAPGWVRRATTDRQFSLDPGGYGFGYLWWVSDVGGHRALSGLGEGQQLLEVVPDLDLVVVALGDVEPAFGQDGSMLQDALNDSLFPGAG